MDIMNYFGIYPDALKRVDRICKNALKKYGANDGEINDVFENAYYLFYKNNGVFEDVYRLFYENICGFYHDSLTNAIIYYMFYAVKSFIELNNDVIIEFFVNGSDSHMYIDGIEIND